MGIPVRSGPFRNGRDSELVRSITVHVREVATSKEAMPTRPSYGRPAQQSLPGDQDQDFPLINIVQEQLHRRIPTTIFRVFVLLFPALLETRDDRHSRKRPSPQRAAQGDAMTSSTYRTFLMGPVVHTTLLSRGYPTVLRTVPWRNQQRVSTATDGSVFGFR